MKNRKIPLRMCIGCREMKNKKEMNRVVRNAQGEVSIDHTGKMAGRGAYICNEMTCLEKAIRAKLLDKTFEQKIDKGVYEQLRREFENRE